jgi:hypothetical protein
VVNSQGLAIFSANAMDILSGLAVAGAIIQLVDFGTKFLSQVVSKRGEIYETVQEDSAEVGFAAVDGILERDAKIISTITAKMRRPLRPNGSSVSANADEKALIELCERCSAIVTEILNSIDVLKTKSSQIKNQKNGGKLGMDNRTSSFLSMFKSVWTEDDLKNENHRISMVRKAVEVDILISIRLDPILLS